MPLSMLKQMAGYGSDTFTHLVVDLVVVEFIPRFSDSEAAVPKPLSLFREARSEICMNQYDSEGASLINEK